MVLYGVIVTVQINLNLLQKSPNWGMGPNFGVSAPPTFVTEIQTNLKV